jgi:hypothetical protein
VVTALVLASCIRPPAPQISSIAGAPRTAEEGGPVVYTVRYGNTSKEGTFRDAVLTVSYARYLNYQGQASPRPDDVDTGDREAVWEIGDMRPGEEGTVEIAFVLDRNIPRTVYELEVTAKIVSLDEEGNRTTRRRSAVTLIEGHPTPTPTPTSTPRPVTPTGTPPTSTPRPLPTSTPSLAREDCLSYDYKALDIRDAGSKGWYLVEEVRGQMRQMLLLDDKDDAYAALALVQRHTAHCFIGRDNTRPNRLDYIVDYWQGDSGKETTIRNEDCLRYNADALRVVNEGKTGWLLTDGYARMFTLDDEQDAQAALALAKKHSYRCFIGRGNDRPDPAAYIVEYWQ